MTRADSSIDERGEPFLIFTRRGSSETPVELCIQEKIDGPLVIYRLGKDKALPFSVSAINHAVMGR